MANEHRIYDSFSEIEQDLVQNAPSIVYKYRGWSQDLHKSLLIDRKLWFSHPFDLNDPLDVRPEHKFDLSEVEDPRWLEMLLDRVAEVHPQLATDRDRRTAAENQWDITRANPSNITDAHKTIQTDRSRFDSYGVFSASTNGLNERLWKEYGEDSTGYCVGFDTVKLCKQVQCSYGYVTYSDSPFVYSFLNKRKDIDMIFLKKTSWSHEEEFRFITAGIGAHSTRLQSFTPDTVAEVLLGENMSSSSEKELLGHIKSIYPTTVSVYKVRTEGNNILREKIVL